MERDRFKKMALKVWQYFNSHAHVERDRILAVLPADFVDFNSHAHVERDRRKTCSDECFRISTHTLTWSVTGAGAILTSVSRFQLTRSRGA